MTDERRAARLARRRALAVLVTLELRRARRAGAGRLGLALAVAVGAYLALLTLVGGSLVTVSLVGAPPLAAGLAVTPLALEVARGARARADLSEGLVALALGAGLDERALAGARFVGHTLAAAGLSFVALAPSLGLAVARAPAGALGGRVTLVALAGVFALVTGAVGIGLGGAALRVGGERAGRALFVCTVLGSMLGARLVEVDDASVPGALVTLWSLFVRLAGLA
jgi:hypothetical protein